MSVKINKNGHGSDPVNVANDLAAGRTVRFTAINVEAVKRFTGNKYNKKVAVIFANHDLTEKATIRFSVTNNNATFNSHRESLTLDSDDTSGLFFFSSTMTSDAVIDEILERYGDFVTGCEYFEVEFGTAVHFLNEEGEIVKTILRINDIIGYRADGSTHRDPAPKA